MRSKKQPAKPASPEQIAVERHVESLMNPLQPDPAQIAQPAKPVEPAPLDIFKNKTTSISVVDAGTAPELPGKTAKSVPADPPLSNALSRIRVRKAGPAAASSQAAVAAASVPTPAPKPVSVAASSAQPEPNVRPAAPAAPSPTSQTASVSSPTDAASFGTAVNVENLARRDAFSDSATDSAVDAIMANEGDELLAAEDTIKSQLRNPVIKKSTGHPRLKKFFTSKWSLLIIPIVLIALAIVPYTRYKIAGLIVKQSLDVTVIDSVTGKPVSGAIVSFKGTTGKTNATGLASFHVALGSGTITISKQYYKNYTAADTVGFAAPAQPLKVNLLATGRQVPLTIINKLTGKPLGGVDVKVLDTSAVSDGKGQVTIVLPADRTTATATISATGYNTLSVPVQVTDSTVPANSFGLVPAGHVYFLASDDSTLDVVKTNLDGSGRQVVLAGTGQEDQANTSLSASHDWRYVVLKSRRADSQVGLYLIDTSTDKVTQFDTSDSTYTPIGWSGHTFVYDLVRTSTAQSQSGREIIKAYNADQLQLNQLDQNQASGDSTTYGYQSFSNFYLLDTVLVYNTLWTGHSSDATTSFDLTGKTDSIRVIQVNGSSKRDLQTYDASTTTAVQSVRPEPYSLYYAVASSASGTTTYYDYENGGVTTSTSLTPDAFTKSYPTYLESPDGTKSFWAQPKGATKTLQVGDKNASSPITIPSSGEYSAYGWYSNQYLLLNLQTGLYIVPNSAIATNNDPVKVSTYYQAAQTPTIYGGGF